MTVEVELPDGTVLEFPDGMSREDMTAAINKLTSPTPTRSAQMKQRAEAAKAGTLVASPSSLERAAASDQAAEDQMTLACEPFGRATLAKFAQGVPFIGQYTDELADLMRPGAGAEVRAV